MTTRTTKRTAGQLTWFDLATSDMEGAKDFYQQLFGWDYFDTGADFVNYTFARSQGRNAAGIGPIWPPDSPQPSAWTVYFASDDAAADSERVQALGGQVMVEAMTISDSGVMAVCADPTGAVFGLWQTINHIGSAVEGEHGSFAWAEVNTSDAAAAKDFYSQLLHASANKMDGMDYYIMQRDQEPICGVQQMDANQAGVPPHWMSYFTVDNTDAAIERATAAGGTVLVPAVDTGFGRMAMLSDPFHTTFRMIQPPAT